MKALLSFYLNYYLYLLFYSILFYYFLSSLSLLKFPYDGNNDDLTKILFEFEFVFIFTFVYIFVVFSVFYFNFSVILSIFLSYQFLKFYLADDYSRRFSCILKSFELFYSILDIYSNIFYNVVDFNDVFNINLFKVFCKI